MIDLPKRTGYRLTYDAECLYNDWQEIGGCSCHTGCAPCSSCCSEGNPISLEENDEAWELDYTIANVYNAWKLKQEMEMSRQDITNKSDPPKSEWFGFKYRVTPESSKLLQEAVFKDGGGWVTGASTAVYEKEPYLYVETSGIIVFGNDESSFELKGMPEKQPPQPVRVAPTKKDFVAGKWYKCVDGYGKYLVEGTYHKFEVASTIGTLKFEGAGENGWWKAERFDINSESDYNPNPAKANPAGYTTYVVFKQDFTEGALRKGEYGGKEYAYKCSRDDYMQWLDLVGLTFDEDVFAEVNVSGVEKKVKVLRIEAKVDPKATKSVVRILPNSVDTDVKESRIDIVTTGFTDTRYRDIVVTKGVDFEVGKHYRPLVGRTHLTQGKYYKVVEVDSNKNCLRVIDDEGDKVYFGRGGFHPVALEDDLVGVKHQVWDFKKIADLDKSGNNATTNVGDINMSTQNRVVSVKFFDDDAGLKAEHSLVAEYQVTTRVSDQMTISKVLLTEDVAGDIAAHNEVRAATVDLNILKNTGNKVFLMPVEFEDLRVEVRQV